MSLHCSLLVREKTDSAGFQAFHARLPSFSPSRTDRYLAQITNELMLVGLIPP